jgi:hypothetical protein
MSSCCFVQHKQNLDLQWINYNASVCDYKAHNARITAIALGFLTIFLLAGSFVLFGLGTLPPTFLMGLGVLPYLGGAFLSFVALGVLFGMLIFIALAAVRTSQKEHWQAVAKQRGL